MKGVKNLVKKKTNAFPISCCGMTFGWKPVGIGFFIGAPIGFLVGYTMFHFLMMELILTVCGGVFGGVWFLKRQVALRQKAFRMQFCDYLDAISTSLSCGKNTYDTFLGAAEDMNDLYATESPICMEAGILANKLMAGERLGLLLREMAEHAACEDVNTFSEVYTICERAGGNLKQVVDECRLKLTEKITIENEIQTILSGPKNELNIMTCMPLIVLAAMKAMNGNLLSYDALWVNFLSLIIFSAAYLAGRKMVRIRV